MECWNIYVPASYFLIPQVPEEVTVKHPISLMRLWMQVSNKTFVQLYPPNYRGDVPSPIFMTPLSPLFRSSTSTQLCSSKRIVNSIFSSQFHEIHFLKVVPIIVNIAYLQTVWGLSSLASNNITIMDSSNFCCKLVNVHCQLKLLSLAKYH